MKTSLYSIARGTFLLTLIGYLSTGIVCAELKYKDQLEQSFTVNTDGMVEIHNVNGSTKVIAWDQNEVKLEAVKAGRSQEEVDAVKIDITSSPDKIVIETKYPETKARLFKKSNNTQVFYTLHVPASLKLTKAREVNGSLLVEGVKGDIEASTVNGTLTATGLARNAKLESVNGAMKVSFERLGGGNVSLSNVNGSIDMTLPPNPDANVSFTTVNGGIGGDIPAKKKLVGNELQTVMGDGKCKVKGSTVNGAVRIHLTNAGS